MNPLLAGPFFIIAGIIKKVYPPKTINSIYGYRTTSSMLNHDTWTVANNYSAQFLQISGIIQLSIGMALFYLFSFRENSFF
ncbi:SdpI family protein [Solitalea lacus]|uniref:SdpI family protein n=1 Tax=Solitalea lacus TaxID=2911172 RepID=UPI001EDBA77A|nr:SdpI family protein [Solitalea lacus]UKJ08694.1 SdpI family protein [Solitalea lacus]